MFTYVKKLTDMSKIEEYIWIHVIDIYNMKNKAKYYKLFSLRVNFKDEKCSTELYELFVIEYQYNVSVNSPWICINTNSTLLGLSSSPTTTQKAATTDMICKSAMTPDATSGREQLWENLI